METRAVKRSVIIKAPVADIWRSITDPQTIKKWFFGTEVSSDWKEGSPITYCGLWKGKEYKDKGKIIKLEKEKKLELTYLSSLSGVVDIPENYSTIIYEMEEKDNQTLLSITQTGDMSKDAYDECGRNWETVLQLLKELMEKEEVAIPMVS